MKVYYDKDADLSLIEGKERRDHRLGRRATRTRRT